MANETSAFAIDFSEDGTGTYNSGSGDVTFKGGLTIDLGPGGLNPSLQTGFSVGANTVVKGDVILQGPSGALSVIRFNSLTFGTTGVLVIVYYSLAPQVGSCIADTGLPTDRYANTLIIPVSCPAKLLNYTPAVGQPGYVSGYILTYNFLGCPADTCASQGGTE
jgi:hypothetical protein